MEDVLTQLTRQFLPQMTAAEKSRALRSLKALIDAELFELAASEGAEDDPDRACPWCGSPHYWIGNTYLDDFGRDSPASLNSTGDM